MGSGVWITCPDLGKAGGGDCKQVPARALHRALGKNANKNPGGNLMKKRNCSDHFTSNIPTLQTTPPTRVTVVGPPYTEQHTSVRFKSVDDHTTDWLYGHGVPIHGTKHECSIQVIRRPMHGVTPLTGVTDARSPCTKTRVRFRSVDDPWGHIAHWG